MSGPGPGADPFRPDGRCRSCGVEVEHVEWTTGASDAEGGASYLDSTGSPTCAPSPAAWELDLDRTPHRLRPAGA